MADAARRWELRRGATVVADGTRFAVWAPAASRVEVLVHDGARVASHPLPLARRGLFEGVVAGVTAGTDYHLALDGGEPRPDPVSRMLPRGVHGPSRVIDPREFRWTDAAWRGLPMADHVIYELHVGTFTHAGTFDGVAERLDDLRELGATAIELMPVAEFPGARNWGYDGASPYAVHHAYGGPEGLRRLVNAAHGAGLAVVLDVVYNHLGPEGNYLPAFGPYFTGSYRTPWGPALNFDGPESDEVRRYFIDNARYWVHEYHIDALRLDAVHGIFDAGALHLLRELTEAVHRDADRLGRRVAVIAESDLNDPRLVRSPEVGGYGMDAQWADDLHHAIHAAITGEQAGYYADFGGVQPVARALAHPYVYAGEYSAHRRRRHGAPATGVPNDRFVVALQNHDQVGNRASGERLAALVPPERCRLGAALLLLSPYVPLLFMGEEHGETNPFLYFVSHGDPALVEAVRKGRREEFASFGWGAELPDPQAEETFERSRPDWTCAATPGSTQAALRALYRDLLALRRAEPALRPGDARADVVHDPDEGWIVLRLVPNFDGHEILSMFNLSDSAARVPARAIPHAGWRLLLTTDDPRYAPDAPDAPGTRTRAAAPGRIAGGPDAEVVLAPAMAAVYRREGA